MKQVLYDVGGLYCLSRRKEVLYDVGALYCLSRRNVIIMLLMLSTQLLSS